MLTRWLLSLTLLLPLTAQAPAPVAPTAAKALTDDGPFVVWEGREARVMAVRQGHLQEQRQKPPVRLDVPTGGSVVLYGDPLESAPVDFPEPSTIAAVSDVHGNLNGLLALLRAQKVIDAQNRWAFGKGHLVVVGDTFDRGAQVTEALWFYRVLEAQAREAGGRLHVLLGNHEMMVLRGDLRYVAPKYLAFRSGTPRGTFESLFGPQGEFGRWLRARPVAVRLGSFLFIHGGPAPELVKSGLTLDQLNTAFRMALDETDRSLMMSADGPVWYRGLVPGADKRRPDATKADVNAALKHFGVKAMVIGHTTHPTITRYHQGTVFAVDADLMSGKPGELWLWREGKAWRGKVDGSREAL